MSAFDLLLSALLTLLAHATVLLGAVWLAERAGWLRHAGWAEIAWRTALLGALLSTTVHVARLWPETGTTSAAVPEAANEPAPDGRRDVARGEPVGGAAPVASRDAGAGATPSGATPIDATPSDAAVRTAKNAAPPPAGALALPGRVAVPLVAAWLLALAVALGRFARQAVSVRRLAREAHRRGAPAPARLVAEAAREASTLGVAPPSLHLLAGVGSPMLLPGRRLLLPAWVPSLSEAQRRALLAHELAHLQRGDPAWRLLQRAAALPLCVHPLAWHALARLEALAEDACDARAAQAAGSGRPLAECLAACLAHATSRTTPAFAVAMADHPGPVVRRVRNLLENSAMSDRPVSPSVRRAAIALGVALAIAIPGVAVTTMAAHAFGDGSITRLSLDGENQFRYSSRTDDRHLSMEVDGEVAFNDAENDVVRLGKGASVEIAEDVDGVEREVRIFGRDGKIVREYRVDGDVVAFDPAGRAWLAQMLPALFRESGIDADARGKRILAKGGTDALLAEIGKIRGDYARRRYLGVLFADATLDDAQVGRALALAKQIDSDFELRNALQAAAGLKAFPEAQLATLLDAASSIDSDFELAELLTTIVETHRVDGALLPAWRKALAHIGSDFEHRRVLDALLERGAGTPGVVVLALDAAENIGSDFERRQVLEAAVPYLRDSVAARDAWFRSARGISSDFEARSALNTAIDAGPVDVAFADHVLAALGDIGSDFEKGEVLAKLAARMPDDAGLRERYRARARELGDFERGQAEKALDRFAAN